MKMGNVSFVAEDESDSDRDSESAEGNSLLSIISLYGIIIAL